MTLKNTLIFVFIVLFNFKSTCQREANIWYFGENAGLDFNNSNPIPLLDGQLNSEEGSTVMSDVNGELLFYTDGVTVWNKQHQVMLNGNELNGHQSSFQSSIIIPKPANTDIYYIFTTDSDVNSNGLQYSEVDMSLDNGLGGITSVKNRLLHTPVPEFLAATKSSESNSYWLVSHKWDSNDFIAFNISESGVNETPVTSTVGSFVQFAGFQGSIKISPDGTQLAMGSVHEDLQLFDFDASSGIVSNPRVLHSGSIYSGLAFAPNNKVLYSVQNSNVYQYNLEGQTLTEIINSRRQLNINQESCIDENKCIFGTQLAPNGKIYFAKRNSAYLSVVHSPDNLVQPDFEEDDLYLAGLMSREGLPSFVSTFLQDGISFTNTCYGAETQFSLINNRSYNNIHWNFGDPASGIDNTSTLASPTHIFSAPGTYQVTVSITYGTEVVELTISVTIFNMPFAYEPNDMLNCDGDLFNLNDQNSQILNGQSLTEFTLTYHISPFDANEGINPVNTNFSSTVNPQIIYARLENTNNPECYDTTAFSLETISVPNLSLADTYYLCENSSLTISINENFDNYLWSTGETSSSIIISTPGKYSITVSNNDSLGCEFTETITVLQSEISVINDIDVIDFTAFDNSIIINVSGNGDYEYSLDNVIYQDSNQFNNLSVDEYTVYVRDKLGCGVVAETVYLLGAPIFFTPNGDGNNDTWQITNGFTEPTNVIRIFDRYGKLIKQLSPIGLGWDGTYNGNLMPTSDYWFTVERQDGRTYTGHFTLKR